MNAEVQDAMTRFPYGYLIMYHHPMNPHLVRKTSKLVMINVTPPNAYHDLLNISGRTPLYRHEKRVARVHCVGYRHQ